MPERFGDPNSLVEEEKYVSTEPDEETFEERDQVKDLTKAPKPKPHESFFKTRVESGFLNFENLGIIDFLKNPFS